MRSLWPFICLFVLWWELFGVFPLNVWNVSLLFLVLSLNLLKVNPGLVFQLDLKWQCMCIPTSFTKLHFPQKGLVFTINCPIRPYTTVNRLHHTLWKAFLKLKEKTPYRILFNMLNLKLSSKIKIKKYFHIIDLQDTHLRK